MYLWRFPHDATYRPGRERDAAGAIIARFGGGQHVRRQRARRFLRAMAAGAPATAGASLIFVEPKGRDLERVDEHSAAALIILHGFINDLGYRQQVGVESDRQQRQGR
jgi:hypothetical protein